MQLVRVANGVYHGRAFRHHSMVVEFPTFVAVVEAPYLDTQTRVLAKAIETQFPDKPIRYAAVTHPHFDHIGGIRAMAALGATILVEKRTGARDKKILEAPHTHPPDDLAKAAGKAGMIETFEGKKEIKEGSQTLQLHAFTITACGPDGDGVCPQRARSLSKRYLVPGQSDCRRQPAAANLTEEIQKAKLRVDTMVGGHGLVGPYAELTKAIAAMKK